MPKPLTAPGRLSLLLPWLNGDFDEHFYESPNPEPVAVRTDYAAIRRVLAEFVGSFDGTAEAAHVVAEPDDVADAVHDEAIGDLEARLSILLKQGFGEPRWENGYASYMPLDKLRMAVQGARRQKPARRGSIVAGGVAALRNHQAAGAYVLRVQGPTFELVPFLVAHLLTAPNMASVKWCERQGCTRFVITATAKRGRPQRFCSRACGEWNREQRKTRRKK